jgi:hypothetical protein
MPQLTLSEARRAIEPVRNALHSAGYEVGNIVVIPGVRKEEDGQLTPRNRLEAEIIIPPGNIFTSMADLRQTITNHLATKPGTPIPNVKI